MTTRTITRRALLILFGLTMTGASLAQSTVDDENDGREEELDQETARRAVREGKARPFSEILMKVKDKLGGQIIEVEFDQEEGRLMYDFTVLQPSGKILEFEVDALTAEILTVEEE